MSYDGFLLLQMLIDMRMEDARRLAESERLIRRARPVRRGWWSRQAPRAVRRLGGLLVSVGERLQQYDLPRSLPLEGKIRGGV